MTDENTTDEKSMRELFIEGKRIGKHSIQYSAKTGKTIKGFVKWFLVALMYLFFYYIYLNIFAMKGFEFANITLLFFLMVSIWQLSGKVQELTGAIKDGKKGT